jgi:hypothetical protein
MERYRPLPGGCLYEPKRGAHLYWTSPKGSTLAAGDPALRCQLSCAASYKIPQHTFALRLGKGYLLRGVTEKLAELLLAVEG